MTNGKSHDPKPKSDATTQKEETKPSNESDKQQQ